MQLPQIDLKISAYEVSTRNFLKAVTNYKNRAIATLGERKTVQSNEKKRIQDKTQTIETETNACKVREIELVIDLEREKEERKDAELSVAAFKRQLSALKEKCQSIESEIAEYRAIVVNLQREKDVERTILKSYALRTSPELQATENVLGCTVEGIEKDRLLLRFSKLDPADHSRECSLVLDVGESGYKVVTASPSPIALPVLVQTLYETSDFYSFIKGLRAAYQAQLQPTN